MTTVMERQITNNEILFTCKLNLDREETLLLHKQSYSDGTCFYTLQDSRENWKIDYGSRTIEGLIKQIKREIRIDSGCKKENWYKTQPNIRAIYNEYLQWKNEVLANLVALAQ